MRQSENCASSQRRRYVARTSGPIPPTAGERDNDSSGNERSTLRSGEFFQPVEGVAVQRLIVVDEEPLSVSCVFVENAAIHRLPHTQRSPVIELEVAKVLGTSRVLHHAVSRPVRLSEHADESCTGCLLPPDRERVRKPRILKSKRVARWCTTGSNRRSSGAGRGITASGETYVSQCDHRTLRRGNKIRPIGSRGRRGMIGPRIFSLIAFMSGSSKNPFGFMSP